MDTSLNITGKLLVSIMFQFCSGMEHFPLCNGIRCGLFYVVIERFSNFKLKSTQFSVPFLCRVLNTKNILIKITKGFATFSQFKSIPFILKSFQFTIQKREILWYFAVNVFRILYPSKLYIFFKYLLQLH